ncbi:MAG: DMT family transporter, partial [Planctomycetota bacterium]
HVLGSLLGVASGIAFAGVVLCVRGLRGHDSAWVISVCLLTSALVLLPYVIGKGNWPNPKVMTGLALFGASQLALPYILFAWGTREVTSHEASFITLLEPLLVPVWVWLVWGGRPEYEFPASWTLVGGGLILTGLVIRFIRLWNAPPLPPGR